MIPKQTERWEKYAYTQRQTIWHQVNVTGSREEEREREKKKTLNKIAWPMLYSDSRVCYPYVIRLINKFKPNTYRHTHTMDARWSCFFLRCAYHIDHDCSFVCLFVWLLDCFVLVCCCCCSALHLVITILIDNDFFPNHFQYTHTHHTDSVLNRDRNWYSISKQAEW